MKGLDYPEPVKQLIQELKRLPGVGPRSAERVALWLLDRGKMRGLELAQAILQTHQGVKACVECGFFSSEERCHACLSSERETSQICVVEQAADVLKIENSGVYHGLYHCLGGKLSPLDGIGPEQLRITSLLKRLEERPCRELILALGSDVEGEATCHYLVEELRGYPQLIITRIAQGMPAGGGLDHADDLTLRRAMSDRRSL